MAEMQNLGWRFRPGCHWPDGGGRKRLNMHSDHRRHLDHHRFDHHHHVPDHHQQQHYGYCELMIYSSHLWNGRPWRTPHAKTKTMAGVCQGVRLGMYIGQIWNVSCHLWSLMSDFFVWGSSSVELTLGLLKAWLLSESHWKLGREHSKEWTDEDENFNFWVIRWQW